METHNNGLALIEKIINKVRNDNSLFYRALIRLLDFTEEELAKFIYGEREIKKEAPILRRLPVKKKLLIKKLYGTRFIAQSSDVFDDIESSPALKLLTEIVESSENFVQPYEVLADLNYFDVFKALPGNWCMKCVAQNQIIEFCEQYPDCLGEEKTVSIFLCKVDNHMVAENQPWENLIIVLILKLGNKLHVRFDNLCSPSPIMSKGNHHRVVMPVI